MTNPLRPAMPSRKSLDRPDQSALLRWTVGVVAAHLGLITVIAGTLDWRLPSTQLIRTAPMQTRWVPPAPAPSTPQASSSGPAPSAPAKTRIAQVTQDPPAVPSAPIAQAEISAQAPNEEAMATSPAATAPQTDASAPAIMTVAEASEPGLPLPTQTEVTIPVPAEAPAATPGNASAPKDAPLATPELIANANAALPSVALAALPPSAVLNYRLNGQEKGIQYTATGELRWQHNDTAYEMSLSIKAFLLGSRHWRSLGEITSAGLAPTKFSDSWRSERAAHFDRATQRIVFSSNAPTVPLLPGAQDQISLYAQLAAAMAGPDQPFKPGTRLQVQTATVRDALPWLLTLDQIETLTVEETSVQATKWVCQPRNRFDAKVEFWLAPEHAWLPLRIRITQVNGNYIDLNLTGQSPLPPLPSKNPAN